MDEIPGFDLSEPFEVTLEMLKARVCQPDEPHVTVIGIRVPTRRLFIGWAITEIERLQDALVRLSPWRTYRGETVCKLCDGRANVVQGTLGGHATDCPWLTAHRSEDQTNE